MYTAMTVARYIIHKSREIGSPVNDLKLQKILYFVQAEFLVATGKPCFRDEIEAWDFGPVIPIVYDKYKLYLLLNIPPLPEECDFVISKEDKDIMNEIIYQCKYYSASTLTRFTHGQDPWIEAYKKGDKSVISKQSIKEYFEEDKDE